MTLKQLFTVSKWPLCVLFLHGILTVTGWYYTWGPIDKVMHFLGGMSIAAAAIAAENIFVRNDALRLIQPWVKILVRVALVTLAAVLWEFMEFSLDHIFHIHMQPSIADTMGDLLCGLLGGAVIACTRVSLSRKKIS